MEGQAGNRGGAWGAVSERVSGGVSRLLRVERGEWRLLVLAGVYFFLLLCSYYMLRPIRETMGIARGAENLPWLMTATLAAMAGINPLFAALAARVIRTRLIPLVHRFFAVNLAVFCVLLLLTSPGQRTWVGYAFYVWLSVFNLFVVSIFWAFLGDVFRASESKRLFGVIGVGGTLGAILGAWAAGILADSVPHAWMLVIAAVVLEGATWAMLALSRVSKDRLQEARGTITRREPGPGVWKGVTAIAGSGYLQLVMAYMLCFSTTSTLIYTEQGRIVGEAFPDEGARTRAFASIDLYTNIFTLVVQAFLTSRLLKRIGTGWTLTILPLVTLTGFVVLWATPVLSVIVVLQVARRGLNYAVSRPVREMLFAPLGAEEKYKAKPLIDTFVYRAGDMIGGWTPAGLRWIGMALGVAAVPIALGWCAVGLAIGMVERRRLREAGEAR